MSADQQLSPSWPVALTIAGSDSGGGAGIQADLKTFAALGAFGTSAITAITAQNTLEVRTALHLPPELVVSQIMAVVDDLRPRAAKTGMLANEGIILAISETLSRLPELPVVVDPVAFTSTGYPLLEPEAMGSLKQELIPLAALLTPNLREASALSGLEITDDDGMLRSAEAILSLGARAVLVKGGHRSDTADDLFMDGSSQHWFRAERVDTDHTHGTGCSLSAGIAAGLARGLSIREAISNAKEFVRRGLETGFVVGEGRSPINHFHAHQQTVERMYE